MRDFTNMYISPISVDLGASHTGVYTAIYAAGTSPAETSKEGRVYTLEKDKYTLLMNSRTPKRHQRRNIDRRQMAKRLFKLIWTDELNMPWDKETSQAIGFLFNRRGFNYLQAEYSEDVLSHFPQDVFDLLPETFKAELANTPFTDGEYNLSLQLQEMLSNDSNKIGKLLETLIKEPQRIKKEIVYINSTQNLRKYCQAILDNKNIENRSGKIKKVSRWIVEKWQKCGILIPLEEKQFNIDISDHINTLEMAQEVLDKIPDFADRFRELRDSIWNFNESKFDLEKVGEKFGPPDDPSENDLAEYSKTHLNHLAFALYKINDEIKSGGKHRSKYFDEILEVLQRKDHTHTYLKDFCHKLQNGELPRLTPERLKNLIGHINNLELKPLRKYFNDVKHAEGDYWNSNRLEGYFDNWIMREWRVDSEANGKAKSENYRELKNLWQNKGEKSIIDFWLYTDPVYTISPYQNNNNRRPPRCQSLILNSSFLDKHYPNWQSWLTILKGQSSDHIAGFEQALKNLKSGKGNSYFTDNLSGKLEIDSQKRTSKDLDARILQFILDRRKDSDPLMLNDIYSKAKKVRQLNEQSSTKEKWQDKLRQTIAESQLADSLKFTPDFSRNDIFPTDSFMHLICRYYKLRQRAKDGRLFIHPEYNETKRGYENTGRFNTERHLLVYCNHKPRQKKYQTLYDVAGVLQVQPRFLEEKIDGSSDEEVINWLKNFRGLESLCKDSAKAQKDHRGELKLKLNTATNNSDLGRLKTKAENITRNLAEALFNDPQDNRAEKFSSIFSYAQLQNIAFTDRNGNAKTCPVCSLDNSLRMESDELGNAKAQRLPAIATRLIDGAVMKMMQILAKKIADDNWHKIEQQLKNNCKVRIPIITESNRFEFEPELAKLKNKNLGAEEDKTFKNKEDRIKAAGSSICPYTGCPIKEGELDHIIARSQEYGTMNDEANLIYASNEGNQKKHKTFYTISNLHSNYKNAVFAGKNDAEIAAWIEETIWDNENGRFRFGRYLSFINLTDDAQKAFRHALFLEKNSPIRKAVIDAISNRRRAMVNGTQRYFAEILANEFHKKALKLEKANLLDFDYFGVEATSNTKGDGIKDLRSYYEATTKELEPYMKTKSSMQQPYSHLLDATFAFMLALNEHQDDGSLLMNLPSDIDVYDRVDKDGVVKEQNLFTQIRVLPQNMETVELAREKPTDGFNQHRAFTRDSFYRDNYLPIMIRKHKDGKVEVKAGYGWNNSGQWKMTNTSREYLIKLLPLFKERWQYPENKIDTLKTESDIFNWLICSNYFRKQVANWKNVILHIDRKSLHDYWMKQHNTRSGEPCDSFFKFCYSELGYRTEKRKIDSPEVLDKTLKEQDKLFKVKFDKKNVKLPVIKDWQKLDEAWKNKVETDNNADFVQFLDKFFRESKDGKRNNAKHHRARKVYSLPVKTGEGKLLFKRAGWQGDSTYQIINDSDSRSVDNKPALPAYDEKYDLDSKLAQWTQSHNFVKLDTKKYKGQILINTTIWHKVSDEIELPNGIVNLWLRIDDNTRPSIAIKVRLDHDPQILIKTIESNNLLKPKEFNDALKKEFESNTSGQIIIYKGSGFNKAIKEALKTSIAVDSLE